MPEGDTIHNLAARLAPDLVGRTLERATTQGLARPLAGRRVTAVHAHGKHLLIDLDDGTQLRTHLGMYGRFRSYPRAAGDAAIARTSPGRATLVLVTADHVFAWLGARTVEVAARRAPMHGTAVASLGPDILAPDFDPAVAAARAAAEAAARPARTIADVVLDQRVVAGIGNVYKSEVLYVCAIAPRTPASALDLAALTALYATARSQMVANVGANAGPRRTRAGDDRFFVYSRSGRPCPRCRAAIACEQLGDPPRWTWSCPRCQRPAVGAHGV